MPFRGEDMGIRYSFVNKEIKNRLIEYRRDFHRYPELGWMEERTTKMIAKRLFELGYEVYLGEEVCDKESRMDVPEASRLVTGVIGILRGKAGTKEAEKVKVTAFRFDMDALPIKEAQTDMNISYRSQNVGVMHACGHDGHMAVGLGLAEILSLNRADIQGEVRLIFQPAEEGCKGSKSVVVKGWLDDVDEFYSGHIGIGCRELGQIGACMRGFLASTKLNIYFHGKAAHAANAPEEGRNALLAAADFTVKAYEFYEAEQSGRFESGGDVIRMNVGRLVSGSGRNIIADEAYLEVETRGQTSESNAHTSQKICSIVKGISEKYDVTYEIKVVGDVGTGKSDQSFAECGYNAACAMGLGDKYIIDAEFTASEDVVTMMSHVQKHGGKAAYFMFGTELNAEHHNAGFDFNEAVLGIMTEFYAKLLVKKQK